MDDVTNLTGRISDWRKDFDPKKFNHVSEFLIITRKASPIKSTYKKSSRKNFRSCLWR